MPRHPPPPITYISTWNITLFHSLSLLLSAFIFTVIALHKENSAICRRRSKLSGYLPNNVSYLQETYTLDLNKNDVYDVSVSIAVHCRGWDNASKALGMTNCGSLAYATGEGEDCWNEMLSEPNTNISRWMYLTS